MSAEYEEKQKYFKLKMIELIRKADDDELIHVIDLADDNDLYSSLWSLFEIAFKEVCPQLCEEIDQREKELLATAHRHRDVMQLWGFPDILSFLKACEETKQK